MEQSPTVHHEEINKSIREFKKLGYTPLYNWRTSIMFNQFNHRAGTFQLIHYSMVKNNEVIDKIWQVYKNGEIFEFTKTK